jgi:hypothetical protein
MDRQITLVTRGVRSDIEREQTRIGPALSMAVAKWAAAVVTAANDGLPAAQAAAVRSHAVGDESLAVLIAKLLECVNDSFKTLNDCCSKTINESSAAMTRFDATTVGGSDSMSHSAMAAPLEAPTQPPAPAAHHHHPQPPPHKKSVRVLVDASSMTSSEVARKPSATVACQCEDPERAEDSDGESTGNEESNSDHSGHSLGFTRRVMLLAKTRVALKRMSTVAATAAAERLILVNEVVKLTAVARDASHHQLSLDAARLVAGQIRSWQKVVANGRLSNATSAALASLDTNALRMIAARAVGRDDVVKEVAGATLSQPGWRKAPDAPRRRVKLVSVGVSVQPHDLLPVLRVHESTSDSSGGGVSIAPSGTSLTSRDALQSRERARQGAVSFFLCRRCGQDARELRYDASKRKLASLPALPAGTPLGAAAKLDELRTAHHAEVPPILASSNRLRCSPRGVRGPLNLEVFVGISGAATSAAALPTDLRPKLPPTVDWSAPQRLMGHDTTPMSGRYK